MFHIDAVEEHCERRRVEFHSRRVGRHLGHAKTALRQALVIKDEAVAVPHENFYAIESSAKKDKEMSVKWV